MIIYFYLNYLRIKFIQEVLNPKVKSKSLEKFKNLKETYFSFFLKNLKVYPNELFFQYLETNLSFENILNS